MAIKRMDIVDFRKEGFLQETNRRFFHPMGLALEVVIDDNGKETLGGIWDYRDDPEGVLFKGDMINAKLAKDISDLRQSKIGVRCNLDCDANGIQRIAVDDSTVGKSVDKLLFENEWLSVYEHDGWYIAAHESRCERGELVAVLPFTLGMNGNVDKLLGRYEECPAHGDGMQLCSITGGVDHGSNPVDAAIQELWEEGGFRADANDLIDLGTVRPIASSDAKVFLYGIDVTDDAHLRREDSIGDGTKGEEGAYCDWVDVAEAIQCKSANMLSMICRLTAKVSVPL